MRSGAVMALQSGRVHTRVSLALPVKLVDPQEPKVPEDAITENVSPEGARVLVRAPKQPDTALFLHSLTHGFRTSVRVVYCEPLSGGEFGVGLQLRGASVKWAEKASSAA